MSPGAPSRTGFLRVLRGIGLLTWRSHLAWRRLPFYAALLLGLPLLVFLTTSLRAWNSGASRPDDPQRYFNRLAQSLERRDAEMDPEQEEKLEAIFFEEFERSAPPPQGDPRVPETAEDRTKRLKDCFARITARAEEVLNKQQMGMLENHLQRRIRQSEQEASRQATSRTGAYFQWIINFYFLVILPLACVNASGALIRDELQADTLGFLLTRPVSRAQLLAAKYLSQTAWLQLLLLSETLLLFAVGWLQDMQDLGPVLLLLLGAQFLAVFAWSALGVLLGLIAKRYIALALVYGLIVERGIGNIPTNINSLSLTRHLKSLLALTASPPTIYDWPGQSPWLAAGALVLAAVVFLGIAVGLFTFLEYHHTSDAQK